MNILPGMIVTAKGFSGVACHVLGFETERDEDYEWSGEEIPTGRVIIRMHQDDHKYTVDPEDLTPIDEEDFCYGCGQTGCGHS